MRKGRACRSHSVIAALRSKALWAGLAALAAVTLTVAGVVVERWCRVRGSDGEWHPLEVVKFLKVKYGQRVINFEFEDAGGNLVHANAEGTYVKIDSLADIKELAQVNNKVSVSANAATDVLTMSIDQGAYTHKVQIAGLADEYLSL